MSGNSATALATQQSIKAYVDSQVGTVDTLAEVLANGNATGGTNITFGDNDKAIFGAGDDLEIYHTSTGNHSIIEETGGGNLVVRTNGPHIEFDKGSTEYMARMLVDGAVELYYDSALKLATTSTGIDVTGNMESDSVTIGVGAVAGTEKLRVNGTVLTLGGTAATPAIGIGDTNTGVYAPSAGQLGWTVNGTQRLFLDSTGIDVTGTATMDALTVDGTTNDVLLNLTGAGTNFELRATSGNGATANSSVYRLALDYLNGTNTNGFIDFYRGAAGNDGYLAFGSTGTERMRIDASGRLGLGTSSPAYKLSVESTSDADLVQVQSTAGSNNTVLRLGVSGDDAVISGSGGSTGNLAFKTYGTERMRIDSAGNVGIGTSSPETNLHIEDSSSFSIIRLVSSTTENAGIDFGDPDDRDIGRVRYNNSDNSMVFHTNAAEQMRIDSSGNVGIGAASAPSRLTVKSPDNTLATNIAQFDSLNGGAGFKFGYQRIEQIGATTPITFETGGSESMRIDSSGKIGIGTDSPEQPITVGDTSDSQNYIQIKTSATGAAGLLFSDGASTNPAGYLYDHATNSMQFKVNGSEKMRIDSSGNLLVGTTTQSGKVTINNGGSTTGLNVFQTSTATNYVPLNIHNDRVTGGNTAVMIRFQAGDNTDVGSIDSTVTATAYNTSSDQRLKDNIVDAPSASNDIDAIQVRSFDWKADGSHQKYGMVAQELQSVAPEAVSGDADSDEMMGVDYSKLVPMLVKEIQSLRARVAQLETN